MSQLWYASKYAQRFFQKEYPYLLDGLKQSVSPYVLQVGSLLDKTVVEQLDLPFVVQTCTELNEPRSRDSELVMADPAFLPFEPDSFSTVILPHVIETHDLPHQVLREAHRVLKPEGYLVLTGFNPYSFLGLQRLLKRRAALPGRYYSTQRVMDWFKVLDFDVIASAMFQYTPLSKNEKPQRVYQAWESIGDRWLPMSGGAYMIAAKKKVSGNILIGPAKIRSARQKLVAPASAKQTDLKSD